MKERSWSSVMNNVFSFEEQPFEAFSEFDEEESEFDPGNFESELTDSEWEEEMRRGTLFSPRGTTGYRPPGRPPRPIPHRLWPPRRRVWGYSPLPLFVDQRIEGEPPSCTYPVHGTEFVRWVQSALNNVLGLRLPVRGIMDAATRSALRRFQEQHGLPVDGIAGPETKEALVRARGEKSASSQGTMDRAVDTQDVGKSGEPAAMKLSPSITATQPEPMTPASEFDFEFERPEARMEDAGERQRKALAKRLQNTPVGRVLAKMGAKITLEKAPLLHPAHWVRGQSGFEVHCGRQRKINVVFGLFDQQKKSLAWYLFSSTVDSRSKLACKRSGSRPVVKPFGVASAVATITPDLRKSQIDVSELVRDAKSPFATMTLDTKTDNTRITCSLDNLNTKSNGLVHLAFGLRKVSEPSRVNVAIPGKLFFLEVGPFDEEKFRDVPFGPQGIAEMTAISNF
ncbi:MAG: peptidoglycan-binding domain-containing protein [Gammaproteobacteria bacterium]